jgi:heme A synthase
MSEVFPTAVYSLCFLTSAACAWLLMRTYRRNGVRLLLWSGLCFGFLALNNLMVMVDLLLVPYVDLLYPRIGLSLAAVLLLLYGLVWEREEDR